MSNFEIITDSACNLSEETIEKLGIHILTLSYIINDISKPGYEKGQKLDYKAFYDQLRNKVKASTSQVTSPMADDFVRPLLESGKDILYIGMSSGLSGTFEAVAVALKALQEEFPDRKILFEDTLSAGLGQGLLVELACKLRDEGKNIEEIHKWISDNKLKQNIWFTIEDLFHLQRGGRISTAKAFIGSALGVKPILIMDENGKLVNVDKARGRKKSLDYLVDKAVERVNKEFPVDIRLMHGNCVEDAQYVATQIQERIKDVNSVNIEFLEPVIAVHGGPGIVGLIFMGSTRVL